MSLVASLATAAAGLLAPLPACAADTPSPAPAASMRPQDRNPEVRQELTRAEVIAALDLRQRDLTPANLVLTDLRAGLWYLRRGDLASAEALLAQAQEHVDTIYADNPAARQARSTFVPERTKEFKGDPYERALLAYYLGVIDLFKGDYDNARASFRNALLQDGMSASETYQSDMPLMQYLVGWTYWCEGSRQQAREEFETARAMAPWARLPQDGDHVLYLAETGTAPVKKAAGADHELLRYEPGIALAPAQAALREGDGAPRPLAPMEDLYFQASTRGGAAVDVIRAGKASFKRDAASLADGSREVSRAAEAGTWLSAASGHSQGAGALLALSIATKLVSKVSGTAADIAMTEADDRAWDNLPGFLHALPAARADLPVALYDARGRWLRTLRPAVSREGRCRVAYAWAAPAGAAQAATERWPDIAALEHAPAGGAGADDAIDDEGAALLANFGKARDDASAH